MQCPECGHVNDDSAKYCSSCTKELGKFLSSSAWDKQHRRTTQNAIVISLVCGPVGFAALALGLFEGWFGLAAGSAVPIVCGFIFGEALWRRSRSERRWKRRITLSPEAAKEYAALIQWQLDYLGLETSTPLLFRRKRDGGR